MERKQYIVETVGNKFAEHTEAKVGIIFIYMSIYPYIETSVSKKPSMIVKRHY